MKKYLPLIIIIITSFIAFGSGCKTRKCTIELRDQVKQITKSSDQVMGGNISVNWFDGKFNADIINKGKTNSVKGRVRMRTDSLIWISIKPDIAIIEAFRVLISKDSVQFVDYLGKKYFADKISAIKEFINYDISFKMIENIFIGNPTIYYELQSNIAYQNREGHEILTSSDFKTYADARASSEHANFAFQALWFHNKVHKRNLMYDPSRKIEMDLQYLEHEAVNDLLLPKTTQLTVIGDSTNTRFSYTYTKIIVNEPLEFPFTIPDSYERIFLNK